MYIRKYVYISAVYNKGSLSLSIETVFTKGLYPAVNSFIAQSPATNLSKIPHFSLFLDPRGGPFL